MRTSVLVVFSLLMLSAWALFAQMRQIIDNLVLSGGVCSIDPNNTISLRPTLEMSVNYALKAGVGGTYAMLVPESNQLVMYKGDVTMVGDEPQSSEKKLWSIGFAEPAHEMEFMLDGNLVVRNKNDKILWQTNTAKLPYRGEIVKIDPVGTMSVLGKPINHGSDNVRWTN